MITFRNTLHKLLIKPRDCGVYFFGILNFSRHYNYHKEAVNPKVWDDYRKMD